MKQETVNGQTTDLSSNVKTLVWAVAATLVSALASTVVGTLLHRSGADINLPWGLVAALALLGMSAWLARRRLGAVGVGLHVCLSWILIWALVNLSGPGGGRLGGVLISTGSGSGVTFLSQYVSLIWLFGGLVVQLVVLFLPRRLFVHQSEGSHRLNRSMGKRGADQ